MSAPLVPWSSAEVFSLAAEGQVNDRKPHQGVTGKNAGLHQQSTACNFTTTLGVSWRLSERTASGATVTYDYDAFGNKINSTGTTPNSYLYRGEYFDSDLGLYYLRARYYNPLTGRFMNRDPKSENRWDPRSLHRYLYTAADPINGKDPTGRDDEVEYQFLFSGVQRGPLFPGIAGAVAGVSGTKVVGGGLIAAIFTNYLARAFGWITEELELALGPDFHDPNKEPGGPEEGQDPAPVSAGP
ncbi:MAG: RHS repeat-associated core domain-containing protein [Terracidiphilus sp.]